jgi:peptidoglycan/LPS O-acetylase OafA/YrhL
MLVVFSHFSDLNKGFLGGFLVGGKGQFGVMLFFILSGYLMATIYLEQPATWANIWKFGVARFARVMPLYLLAVWVSYWFMMSGKLPNGIFYNIDSVEKLIEHLLFIVGTSVLWSIPVEVQFYAVFVIIWWVFARFKKGYGNLFLSALAIACLYLQSLVPNLNYHGIHLTIGIAKAFLLYFLAGMLLGQVKLSGWSAPAYLRKNFFVMVLLLLPFFFTENYNAIFHLKNKIDYTIWLDLRNLVVMSGLFFILVFLVPDNNIILSNRIGKFLGDSSYSIYILHLPILTALFRYFKQLKGAWPRLGIGLTLVLVLSYASYRLIEIPSRNWLRSLAFPRKNSGSAAEPVATQPK